LISNLEQGTTISQLLIVPISSTSEQRYPAGTQNMLLAVGTLNIRGFGNVSAALYDGEIWNPYLLTTQINGQHGSIQKVIHVTDFCDIKNGRRNYKPLSFLKAAFFLLTFLCKRLFICRCSYSYFNCTFCWYFVFNEYSRFIVFI
jgi:hypothetical protein